MMSNAIKLFFIALIVFFAIDMIWLGLIAKTLYRDNIGFIMSDKPIWSAALIFYVLYIIGLVYFVIYPAYSNGSIMQALFSGLFFGLVTYATYDLTNLATLAGWPLKITIIDLLWGSFLGATVSTSTVAIAINWLMKK